MAFDIEPVFLEAEELVIRNVIDSVLTPRERTSKLNWLFKQEKQGKRPPPGEHAFPYSAAIDLAQCENTIDALNNIVSTEPVSADGTRRASRIRSNITRQSAFITHCHRRRRRT